MQINRRAMLVAVAGFGLVAGLVLAQSNRISQGQVYTAVTPDEVVKVLEGLGYKSSLGTDEFGLPQIKFNVGAKQIDLDLICESGICSRLTLFYRLELAKGTTLEKINVWNAFISQDSRAILDQKNNPTLWSDLDFSGGITLNAVREWVGVFVKATIDFPEYF